ncbi:FAD-dependent monooxygenase [Streptomyces tricolor]|nr:FAD-dependent monooxygenase [Streptomyces tricolor]
MEKTTCCVVGGGPAGMVLALLLARAGIEVTVLEKHADFLRDFRGDTVHPSTWPCWTTWAWPSASPGCRSAGSAPFSCRWDPAARRSRSRTSPALRGPYDYVAMVPQWDLLDLLADEARREPSFQLRTNTEATSFLIESGRVTGVALPHLRRPHRRAARRPHRRLRRPRLARPRPAGTGPAPLHLPHGRVVVPPAAAGRRPQRARRRRRRGDSSPR